VAKKAKVSQDYVAQGRLDAPYLFVFSHVPTDGLWAWWLQTLLDNQIDVLDCRFVFQHNEAPQGAHAKFLVEQTRNAWPRFSAEIRASDPQVVVPLGSGCLQALTGIKEHIFTARGYLCDRPFWREVEHDEFKQVGTYVNASKVTGAKKGDPKMKWVTVTGPPLLDGIDCDVIPMFQLEHITAESFAVMAAVNADLDRAYRSVHGQLNIIDTDFTYETHLSNKVVWHEWGNVIAVDIETHGVNNEVIDCVSFSDGEVTATVPWSVETRQFLTGLFALPERIFALHNSPFDIPRLIQAGVNIPLESVLEKWVFDTMFGGVTIQPDLLKGLGAMASVYLDLFPWKWLLISHADPQKYSAKDAYVTVLLAKLLIAIMQDLGTWDLFMGRNGHPGPGVMATLPMLTESSRIGIRTNRTFALAWMRRLEKHLLHLLKMWNRYFGGYNPLSTKDVKRLFYTEWNLPVQRNKEEGISTDELACMKLREYTREFATHPSSEDEGWRSDPRFGPRVFDLIITIRDVQKQIGTYAQPVASSQEARVYVEYLPKSKDNDGTTHNQAKGNTSTGRLVAFGIRKNPWDPKINIQNQPKIARHMYLPDNDDMCFVQADYVRAEPHVMAYSAGDTAMIEDLDSGDLYTALVNRIDERTGLKIKRKTGKNVFLAGQYLAGGPKKSDMILKQEHVYVSPEECNLIQAAIDGTYHDVAAFKQLLISKVQGPGAVGWIRNPFGRVRNFYSDNCAPQAVDFWPQSTVGDIMWCVMLEVHRAAKKYGGRFTLQVHDSIVVQVPKQHVAAMVADMQRIMCRTFDCVAEGFSIPVDFEVAAPGRPWGEVKSYAFA
jgi:hypothetical protein